MRCKSAFQARVGNFQYQINLKDYITRQLYVLGCFEPSITNLIRALVHKDHVVLDIGANIGYFTMLASKCAGPQGKVFAFEPDPRNYALLKRHRDTNSCANVRIEEIAISDENGSASLNLYDESEENAGTSSITSFNNQQRKVVVVKTMTLDSYIKQIRGNIRLIKIDIEGAEVGAIRGCVETIQKSKVNFFLLELHLDRLSKKNVSEILETFTKANYSLRIVRESDTGPKRCANLQELLAPFDLDQLNLATYPHILAMAPDVPADYLDQALPGEDA
jgi:FkbM family methyltransferase